MGRAQLVVYSPLCAVYSSVCNIMVLVSDGYCERKATPRKPEKSRTEEPGCNQIGVDEYWTISLMWQKLSSESGFSSSVRSGDDQNFLCGHREVDFRLVWEAQV